MDSPFSVPPSPSGAPNSLIRSPFTGNGSMPLAEAKATAGEIRPGSRNAARSGRISSALRSSVPRAANRAERAALHASGGDPAEAHYLIGVMYTEFPPSAKRAISRLCGLAFAEHEPLPNLG